MKILMDKPYTSDERVKFKENIFENVLRNIKTLVEAVQTFKYSLSKPEHKVRFKLVAPNLQLIQGIDKQNFGYARL